MRLVRREPSFHLNSARFSGEDIDQNEMRSVAMKRMNMSWSSRGENRGAGE